MNSKTEKMLRAAARGCIKQCADREEAWKSFCASASGWYCSVRFGIRGPKLDPTVSKSSEKDYTERAAKIFNEESGEAFDIDTTSQRISDYTRRFFLKSPAMDG